MSEEQNPVPPPPPSAPEPVAPPPPPPPGQGAPAGGGAGSNRTLMLVLAYVWLLALIPLLVEKDDKEVQWHSKNGLVILAGEFILWIVLTVLGFVPVLGCVVAVAVPLIFLGFLVLRIIAIVKATKGERLIIPGVSQYADQF